MRPNPRLLLGPLAILLLLLALNFYQDTRNFNNYLILQAKENHFEVDLRTSPQSQPPKVFGELGLPPTTSFNFELDSTSSAKLIYLSPIKTKFNIQKDQIEFKGQTSRSLDNAFLAQSHKIPATTILAIAGGDFRQFLKSQYDLPSEFLSWIDDNINSKGQYLIIFGQNADFSLIFKNPQINFDNLKNLKAEEPIYFQQSQDNIVYHLVKISPVDQRTLALFQLGENIFLSSSYEAARQILKEQQTSSLIFPNLKTPNLSLAILFNNHQSLPQNFYGLWFERQNQTQFLEKISRFELVLKDSQFSGLINFK